jgi:glutamine amidotransferase
MTGSGSDRKQYTAAIVDYGLGNLFSVRHACEYVGMRAVVSAERREIAGADVVILPGVGAFGDAMSSLRRLDLAGPIVDWAHAGKPLVGICLGMQLFMSYSTEFGTHEGLGIIKGPVVKFEGPVLESRPLKVPQVGWNRIFPDGPAEGPITAAEAPPRGWDGTPLVGLPAGAFMYFVHSFYVVPEDPSVILSTSRYGQIRFCSAVRSGSVFAFQFHPERSGVLGLMIYRNILSQMVQERQGE